MEFKQSKFTSIPIVSGKPKPLTELIIRKSLDDTKTSLSAELGDRFRVVLKNLDYYRFLKYILEGTDKPKGPYNFKYKNVSNAWLKMYEMIVELKLDVSTHLGIAELPGSFICAAEEYAKSKHVGHEWLASSYYTSDPASNILGDSYGLLKKYPDRWIGKTGDLTDLADVKLQIKQTREKWPDGVQLITSDAGIGLDNNDVNGQEEACLSISIGDAIIAVNVLKVGGCMISKKFTFSSDVTRILFGLLRNCFEDAAIVKPATSRPANSEVYFYGRSFIGASDEIKTLLETMITDTKTFKMSKLPDYVAQYIESIDTIFDMYAREQIEWLNMAKKLNTSYFKDKKSLNESMTVASSKMINLCTKEYIKNIISK